MPNIIKFRRGILLVVPLSLAIFQAAPVHGQNSKQAVSAPAAHTLMTVELSGVPDALVFPTLAKANHIVTVSVHGGVPTSAWLARSVDSPFTVALLPAAEGRYQFNLSDYDLLLAMRRSGESGQFRVFAKDAGGQVSSSVPISFELSTSAHAVYSAVQDAVETVSPWVHTQRVSSIRLSLDPSLPGTAPKASAGNQSWPLKETSDGNYSLELTPAIRSAWEADGALHLSSGSTLHQANILSFTAIPRVLPIAAGGLSVWVGAHQTVIIPGSNNYLSISCGDVRAASPSNASLDLIRADTPKNDPEMEVGELRAFVLDGGQYAWGPTRIEYLGKVQSRVKVTIWSGAEAESKILAQLPIRMGSQNLTMSFNSNSYDYAAASRQLKELMKKSSVSSVRELLAAIAEREQQTGSECVVHRDNEYLPLRAWVIDELARVGWTFTPDQVALDDVAGKAVP